MPSYQRIDRLKPHLDTVVVFVVSLALLYPQTVNLCHHIETTGFDAQNFYLWEYAASMGVVPHQDLFHLYGYLNYYRPASIAVFLVYALLSPLTYTLLYALFFKRLFPARWLALFALISSFMFIHSALGVIGVARFGLLLLSAVLTTTAITRSVKQPQGLVLVGFFTGLVLLLITVEGLYAVALSLTLLTLHLLTTHPLNQHLLRRFGRNLFAYLLGLIIGLIPLFILNTLLHNWSGFIRFLRHLNYLSLYAKSDFIPTDRTQLLILSVLFTALVILSLEAIKRDRRIKPAYWLLVAATTAALIAQQKNLVRSATGSTLSYVIVTVLGFYGYGLKRVGSKVDRLIAPLLMLVFTFTLFEVTHLTLAYGPFLTTLSQWYRHPQTPRSQLCLVSEAQPAAIPTADRFTRLHTLLQEQYPHSSFFPFPYAPIMYLYHPQRPAPYPNFYDSAPLSAQIANRDYLQTGIDLVLYDLDALVFDSVPEFLRVKTLFAYILDHYQPQIQFEAFTLLTQTATPSSWFTPAVADKFPQLIDRLTRFDLGQLPRLEAVAHTDSLTDLQAPLLTASTAAQLNRSLEASDAASWADPVLLVRYPLELNTTGIVSASSGGELTTQATFRIVNGGDYLFRPQNLPQFHFLPDRLVFNVDPAPTSLSLYAATALPLW